METKVTGASHRILFLNTLAFTVCFAVWMLNGVLVSFLVENQVFRWDSVQVGWLLAIPVLSGSLFRLHAGIWADKYGGRWVMGGLLLFCAIPMYLLSYADSFLDFALCSFGFGLAGSAFAVGIAYTSLWYPKEWQGRALGIFGAGNAGAALTTLFAPALLKKFTGNGAYMDGWRLLPEVYAAVLVCMGVIFILLATNKKSGAAGQKSFVQMLAPLRQVRVWRFGLYYYLVFGCFVALSQWLVPYYLNMYSVSLITAGLMASVFSMPSGLIRALGGWLSDVFGARKVIYWMFITSAAFCSLLIFPKMDITSPGEGVMAKGRGVVSFVSDSLIVVSQTKYPLIRRQEEKSQDDEGLQILPRRQSWQEPVVSLGDTVLKRQLLAKGTTHIYFHADIWVATFFIFIVGIIWGIGKAAVYKHIPIYFPNDVGAVGGMVGMLGGLGGFFSPVIFGYLLQWSGVWTSMWLFLFAVSIVCLWWMHHTIVKMRDIAAPHTKHRIESGNHH